MHEPLPARKVEIAALLLALQRIGKLTVWIDADMITIGPPVGRNMSACHAREHRFWITWQQADRLVSKPKYLEATTRRWM